MPCIPNTGRTDGTLGRLYAALCSTGPAEERRTPLRLPLHTGRLPLRARAALTRPFAANLAEDRLMTRSIPFSSGETRPSQLKGARRRSSFPLRAAFQPALSRSEGWLILFDAARKATTISLDQPLVPTLQERRQFQKSVSRALQPTWEEG